MSELMARKVSVLDCALALSAASAEADLEHKRLSFFSFSCNETKVRAPL